MPCDVYLIDELQTKKIETGNIQKKICSTKRALSVKKNSGCAHQRAHAPTQVGREGGRKNSGRGGPGEQGGEPRAASPYAV